MSADSKQSCRAARRFPELIISSSVKNLALSSSLMPTGHRYRFDDLPQSRRAAILLIRVTRNYIPISSRCTLLECRLDADFVNQCPGRWTARISGRCERNPGFAASPLGWIAIHPWSETRLSVAIRAWTVPRPRSGFRRLFRLPETCSGSLRLDESALPATGRGVSGPASGPIFITLHSPSSATQH